ncbi:MAG: hypothetical protein IJV72_05075 [Clostridia bacterium]|nr:hypothetical protein [Clostridia bacterium]
MDIKFGSEFSMKLPDISKVYISSKDGKRILIAKTVKKENRDDKISDISQKRDNS